ncbi:MAG: hypothetical protein R3C45_07365 [Phycisphaerales bacterium]
MAAQTLEGQVLVLGGVGIGVHDWGVSIILLMLVVRLILHPIARKPRSTCRRWAR